MNLLRRVVDRINGTAVPDGFTGELADTEHVLASAPLRDEAMTPLLASSHGLWLPGPDGYRRLGWHRIAHVRWQDPTLAVTEAVVTEVVGGVEILADRAPVTWSLARPGRLPAVVRARVQQSITDRQRRELDDAGVWFVQRREPGRDGVLLQVLPDAGLDPDRVRQLCAAIGDRLHE